MEIVLPMMEQDYLQTFDTDAARAEFRELTAGHRLLCLRHTPIPEEGRAQALEDAYWASGEWVVRRCDILFALWDGKPSKGRGGTSYVVEFARNLGRPIVVLWTDGCTETVRLECQNPAVIPYLRQPDPA